MLRYSQSSMGNTNAVPRICQDCRESFQFHGEIIDGAQFRCERCTKTKNVDIRCAHCKHIFQGNLPVGYGKKNNELLCQTCSEKKHEMICSTCRAPFDVFEQHQSANCSKCAKFTQDKLNKGKYKRFSLSVNNAEASFVCPRKTAKNIQSVEELNKAFNCNRQCLLQLQGEVVNDDHVEVAIERDQQQLHNHDNEAAGPQPVQ